MLLRPANCKKQDWLNRPREFDLRKFPLDVVSMFFRVVTLPSAMPLFVERRGLAVWLVSRSVYHFVNFCSVFCINSVKQIVNCRYSSYIF